MPRSINLKVCLRLPAIPLSPSSPPRELTWIPSVAVLTYNSRRQPLSHPTRTGSQQRVLFSVVRKCCDYVATTFSPPRDRPANMPRKDDRPCMFLLRISRSVRSFATGFSSMRRAYRVSIIPPNAITCHDRTRETPRTILSFVSCFYVDFSPSYRQRFINIFRERYL